MIEHGIDDIDARMGPWWVWVGENVGYGSVVPVIDS